MSTESDQQRALDRIRLMLPRTEANGASPSEVEAAAKHIGRLVMKFPQLLSGATRTEPDRRKWPQPPPDWVTFPHSGIIGESAKAILVVLRGEKFWLPKAHIQYTSNQVAIERWLAIAKGLI